MLFNNLYFVTANLGFWLTKISSHFLKEQFYEKKYIGVKFNMITWCQREEKYFEDDLVKNLIAYIILFLNINNLKLLQINCI